MVRIHRGSLYSLGGYVKKGERKKGAKEDKYLIRLSKKNRARAQRNADRFCGGNLAVWFTLRAVSRTQEEFELELDLWHTEQDSILARRLKRLGYVDASKTKPGKTRGIKGSPPGSERHSRGEYTQRAGSA